jgi:hypothetical protein
MKTLLLTTLLITLMISCATNGRCIKKECVVDDRPAHLRPHTRPRVMCRCIEWEEIEDETDIAYPDNFR